MTDALDLGEAVELGYPLASGVAAAHGIRLLCVKGPILGSQGLRDQKQSVDVDVLVEPAKFDALRAALVAVGWHQSGTYNTPGIVPLHSVTHRHPCWPVELDVHRWFPGFLADPSTVFEAFWQRRTSATLAHAPVPVPDHVSHAALAALHYLRDSATAWGQENLSQLAERVSRWEASELGELSDFAARTGAAETLGSFLVRVGAPDAGDGAPLVVSLSDWSMRAEADTQVVLPWLVGLRRLPWHRRPKYLAWSLWLNDAHFRAQSEEPMTRRDVMRARWRRLRRGLGAFPAARASARSLRERRAGDDDSR